MEVLAELGLIVAVVMLLIVLVIVGVLMLIEEIVFRVKKLHVFFLLRQ